MATQLDIVNNALLLLGDDVVETVSASSSIKRSRLMAELWDEAYQFVLRSHPWNFAVARAELSGSVAETFGEWTYKIPLPSDCLRVLSVGLEGYVHEYRLEGGYILTDEQAPQLRYIYDEDDPANWTDPAFVQAVQYYLAWQAAYPLTKSGELHDRMRQNFLSIVQTARTIDGQEQPPEESQDFPLLSTRHLGGRRTPGRW